MLASSATRQPAPMLACGAVGRGLSVRPNAFGNALGSSLAAGSSSALTDEQVRANQLMGLMIGGAGSEGVGFGGNRSYSFNDVAAANEGGGYTGGQDWAADVAARKAGQTLEAFMAQRAADQARWDQGVREVREDAAATRAYRDKFIAGIDAARLQEQAQASSTDPLLQTFRNAQTYPALAKDIATLDALRGINGWSDQVFADAVQSLPRSKMTLKSDYQDVVAGSANYGSGESVGPLQGDGLMPWQRYAKAMSGGLDPVRGGAFELQVGRQLPEALLTVGAPELIPARVASLFGRATTAVEGMLLGERSVLMSSLQTEMRLGLQADLALPRSLASLDADLATTAAKRSYLNEKFGRTGDLNLDINIRGRQEVASNFFLSQGVPEGKVASYLTGIDFTRSVELQTLGASKQLWQYQTPGAPQGNWYALSQSVQPTELGISPLGFNRATLSAEPKVLNSYITTEPVTMLRSTSASVEDFWSVPGQRYFTVGGAQQLFSTQGSLFRLGPK